MMLLMARFLIVFFIVLIVGLVGLLVVCLFVEMLGIF